MLGFIADQCVVDVEERFAAVKAGEGRLMACLRKAWDAVSQECKAAITDATAIMQNETSFANSFLQSTITKSKAE